MKKQPLILSLSVAMCFAFISCNSGGKNDQTASTETSASSSEPANQVGQSTVIDTVSQKNIVQVASGSPDFTTLVTAVKAADLVDALSNNGPFTVFAPNNAAFDKLPKGTVEGLLKPGKKADLQNILQYHVFIGVIKKEKFKDGQDLGMVNDGHVRITVKDGKVRVNDANIIASIPASNGIIHVVDAVLLPPVKK